METMRVPVAAGAVAAVTLAAALAWAAPGFRYKIENQKAQTDGKGPALVLEATDSIEKGKVTLERDGDKRTVELGKMRDGASKRIELDPPKGTTTYRGTIEATGPDGKTVSIGPLRFEVTLVDPIAISVDKDEVDVGKGRVPFTVNRPLDRIEYSVVSEKGGRLASGTEKFGGKNGRLVLDWKADADADVKAVEMKAYDTAGFWVSVMLEPWHIDIPHEEVIFEFGKASWKDAETAKLESSKEKIEEAKRKYARFRPDMRLYIAGYTDTVGSPSSNRKLSRKRARAIAKWFDKHGIDMPIYYQGFGEKVLAVDTPDETPEPKNRRAVYILGNSAPPTSSTIPRSNWKRIR
jgi:outer membrane protein OmpA-like peptidoglycan-associated protein